MKADKVDKRIKNNEFNCPQNSICRYLLEKYDIDKKALINVKDEYGIEYMTKETLRNVLYIEKDYGKETIKKFISAITIIVKEKGILDNELELESFNALISSIKGIAEYSKDRNLILLPIDKDAFNNLLNIKLNVKQLAVLDYHFDTICLLDDGLLDNGFFLFDHVISPYSRLYILEKATELLNAQKPELEPSIEKQVAILNKLALMHPNEDEYKRIKSEYIQQISNKNNKNERTRRKIIKSIKLKIKAYNVKYSNSEFFVHLPFIIFWNINGLYRF